MRAPVRRGQRQLRQRTHRPVHTQHRIGQVEQLIRPAAHTTVQARPEAGQRLGLPYPRAANTTDQADTAYAATPVTSTAPGPAKRSSSVSPACPAVSPTPNTSTTTRGSTGRWKTGSTGCAMSPSTKTTPSSGPVPPPSPGQLPQPGDQRLPPGRTRQHRPRPPRPPQPRRRLRRLRHLTKHHQTRHNGTTPGPWLWRDFL
jgi:hypothetical protein